MVTWKPKQSIARARSLRTEFLTEAEKRLWFRLRSRQIDDAKFRRQHPLGPYVLDFVCVERLLVIELDGGQHGFPAQAARDDKRTEFLEAQGFQVLRFWNNDVMDNIEGVLETIASATAARPTPPGPLSRTRARGSKP
ncbi:MAG: endonuclease domain-containing protein [Magnetospirillum sp.]|nr:endonuclease domain-containing protein [Magnetospirillum sp.]